MGDIGFIAGICAEAAVALALIILIIAIAKKSKKKKRTEEAAKSSEQSAENTARLLDSPRFSELPQAKAETSISESAINYSAKCSIEPISEECYEVTESDTDTYIPDVSAEISFSDSADAEDVFENSNSGEFRKDDEIENVEIIYAESVSRTVGSSYKNERDAIDTVVIAKNKFDNIIDAYEAMSREQKSFYDNLKKYALSKEGTTESLSRHYECVKMGKRIILKLQIKRGITCASFMLENSLLKSYRKSAAKAEGADIKIKETQVNVSDLAGFETAKDMIDLMIENIKREKAEKKNKSKPAQ